MLSEGRRGGKGEAGREGRKSGHHSPICVCPLHTITMTSSFSSSSKEPGLLMDRWTNGQMGSLH